MPVSIPGGSRLWEGGGCFQPGAPKGGVLRGGGKSFLRILRTQEQDKSRACIPVSMPVTVTDWGKAVAGAGSIEEACAPPPGADPDEEEALPEALVRGCAQ
eukprot:7879561-Pyramimonas_sp.AAC.2